MENKANNEEMCKRIDEREDCEKALWLSHLMWQNNCIAKHFRRNLDTETLKRERPIEQILRILIFSHHNSSD